MSKILHPCQPVLWSPHLFFKILGLNSPAFREAATLTRQQLFLSQGQWSHCSLLASGLFLIVNETSGI